ncbi:MAG: autotransporter domain-containing protein [Parvibaculum sp.]|nr:autotransporter domain-containing protein [Parvibaculum sp.]
MKTVRYRALKRVLTGAASAAVILWAIGGEAQASVGCNALSGASFSYTGTGPTINSFSQQLDGGANFTVDPGDTLTINVVVPPNSIVTVNFLGQNITFDNRGSGTTLADSANFTVPDTGGPATGPVNLVGETEGTNTLTVDIDCTNVGSGGGGGGSGGASDAAQSAGQADTVVQSIVPGGIDGNLFGDFGVPLNPFGTGLLSERPIRQSGDCDDALSAANQAVQEAQADRSEKFNAMRQVAGEASKAIQARVAAENIMTAIQREHGKDRDTLSNKGLGNAEAQAIIRARIAQIDALFRNFSDAKEQERAAKERFADAEQALAEADRALADATAELERVKAKCAGVGGSASLAPSPLPLLAFAPIVPDPGKLFAGFDLASERRAVEAAEGAAGHPEGLLGDERFNLWVNGGITFHRDRTTSGQEGETITFGTGASWRFTPDINAGAAFRYARTDRDGASGETKADTWSVALFAQTKLVEEVMLNAIASYSRVDLDLGFKTGGVVTATGSTNADSLAGQLTVTRSFRLGDWQVTPNLGASIVNVSRDAFTRSDAVAVPASDSTQVSVSGGPTVSTTLSWVSPQGQEITVSPSFGLQAYANVGKFDSVAGAAGARTENDTIGLSANAGLGADLGGGVTLGLGTSWAGIGADQQNISLSAQLTIPLN